MSTDSFDPNDLEAEGIPAIEDAPPGMDDAYNQVEGMMPPRDHPMGAEEFGITQDEQRTDEPLAERVRREEPETMPADDAGVGRLVEPDQGVAGLDDEPTNIAGDSADSAGMSAEESAVHITDTP